MPAPLDTLTSRIGLGCMRLPIGPHGEDEAAVATIHAALDGGVRLLDTARAYGRDDRDRGGNERLVARAVAAHPAGAAVLIVTKGGMRRQGAAWQADGRARTLLADAEASVRDLGRPPDLWLLHAPDPRVPLATSLRAMATLLERGLARAVGLSNVSRTQLEAAAAVIPLAAVEVALGPFDETALRGGVVEWCAARGIPLLAHSPLGGPARAAKLARDPAFAALAAARGTSAARMALAWLLDLAPVVIPIPGARRPETARDAAAAAGLVLTNDERQRLAERLPGTALARSRPSPPPPATEGEVVIIMGLPGAGKTRLATEWADRGYARLNRDERGGTLRGLAQALDQALSRGARRVLLDNTYVTRASRSDVITAAGRHGLPVRCVWLDTPAAQAQINLCLRLVEEFGHLPSPEEIRASRSPGVMGPTPLGRFLRQLEPPSRDEGLAVVEVVPFVRAPAPSLRAGVVIPADDPVPPLDAARDTPLLALGWRPGAGAAEERTEADRLGQLLGREVAVRLCPHPGGPPICWCRPPLPGAVVEWAVASGVDLAHVRVAGASPTFRTLARAFGD